MELRVISRDGKTAVSLDGLDIARITRSVSLSFEAGRTARVDLELLPELVRLETDDADVHGQREVVFQLPRAGKP